MLDRLNANEQYALMELLIYMAKADGTVADIEAEVLEKYAHLVDIRLEDLNGNLEPKDVVPLLESPASRAIILQEMLRLSHIDGYFADDEQSAIVDLAAELGIPMALVSKLDAWVVNGLRWVLEGEDLLDEAEQVIRMDRVSETG